MAENAKPAPPKEKASPPKEKAAERKVKTTVITFSGTGWGLLGYALALALTGVVAFIPLPLVTVACRKWFYRNLAITDSGRPVTFSFEGSGAGLLKYWIPSLVLLAVTGTAFYYGVSNTSDGFLSVLLVILSIVALLPQAWLWVAKKKYTLAHTRGTVGSVPVTFSFSGKGTTALLHGLKMIFSFFVMCLPMPWAITSALHWSMESTDVTAGASYKPTFSGTGGSLFWYGVGIAISPLFVFLILPALLKGLIAWFARYTNIVGTDQSIEFEFTGTKGPLFAYVYLVVCVAVVGMIVNGILGNSSPVVLRGGIVAALFLAVLPFVKASFLRWCAAHLDVIKK